MSNRVEELETKVSELQAAVNGLTEELVETKERVRLLEDAVAVDDPTLGSTSSSDEPVTEPESADDPAEPDADADPATDEDDDADADPATDEDDDEPLFVDADEHEQELQAGGDEEPKSTEENDEETESEQDGSDIIVA